MSELQYLKELKTNIEARIAEIESNQAPVKWEPKGGLFTVTAVGEIVATHSLLSSKEFGTERETREQAEYAAEWMRKFNRLFCWFVENAPGHDIDILFDGGSASIAFIAYEKTIDDLRKKIRDGVVEL